MVLIKVKEQQSRASHSSSEMQHQHNGALVCDAVVRESPPVHHLTALVQEPLLAGLHPLSGLHLLLKVLHGLVGPDVVLVQLPVLGFQEHLDGRGLCEHQGDLGAGLQTAGADRQGVVAEGLLLAPVEQHQQLPGRSHRQHRVDLGFQRAHRVLWAHPQTAGCPIQHNHIYIHD